LQALQQLWAEVYAAKIPFKLIIIIISDDGMILVASKARRARSWFASGVCPQVYVFTEVM
jgi:hypothetical protein